SGFVEGQNIAVEYRYAEGQIDRLPSLVADLVRRQVAIIVTCNGGLPDIEVPEDCGHHCALRPMILINCSMFLTSLATSLLISCGLLVAQLLPFWVIFAMSSGVWAAFTNSRFSLSTMAVGVPAGANTPAQSATLCAPSPASIKVGMSGSAGSRVSASTA